MFVFSVEDQLIDYIIKNKDKIKGLENKKIIGGKEIYGKYLDKKARVIREKHSDIVMSDEEAIYFIEVKCTYITPLIFNISRQAIERKDFYKDVRLIFIGTKISSKVKEKIDKDISSEYIIIDNVNYTGKKKNQNKNEDESEDEKSSDNKNIELYAYKILNYGFNIRFHDVKKYYINNNETELKIECRFFNKNGINIYIVHNKDKRRMLLQFEIVKINKQNEGTVLVTIYRDKYDRFLYDDLGNIYNLVKKADKDYITKENAEYIINAIPFLRGQTQRDYSYQEMLRFFG